MKNRGGKFKIMNVRQPSARFTPRDSRKVYQNNAEAYGSKFKLWLKVQLTLGAMIGIIICSLITNNSLAMFAAGLFGAIVVAATIYFKEKKI